MKRKSSIRKSTGLLAGCLSTIVAGLLVAVTTAVAAPPSVSVVVDAQTSTGASGSVTPTHPGGSDQWVYDYTINNGGSVTDTLPLAICVTTLNAGWSSLTLEIGLDGAGGNLPGVTLPSDQDFTSDGCAFVSIDLSTGSLSTGNYQKNVLIKTYSSTPGNTHVDFVGHHIHIRVHVLDASSAISCFTTDSNFNYLLDCNGNEVNTSGDDGRFAIVANNKRIEVATNPGQFYYNVLWDNTTGLDQTVSVSFVRDGVKSHGAQAIHAKVFPPSPPLVIDAAEFDAVNNSIPSGHDDSLESILVPAGWTLWVDYHLAWSGIGSLVPPGCAISCGAANQLFQVTATVSGDGIDTAECEAGATGYKK
jgi:hypothetical protein